MNMLEKDSKDVLTSDHCGDHLILWYTTSKGRTQAIAKYLIAGIEYNEILIIVLPFSELQELEESLKKMRFSMEKSMNEGRLFLFASEEILPTLDGDYRKFKESVEIIKSIAVATGKNIRIVGRVAPILFEQGDHTGALTIEEIVDSYLANARLVCLYDARQIHKFPIEYKRQIDNVHTHSLSETKEGKIQLNKPIP
ncbi:MAG: MEDS domain-containing protein [Candidatus Hodarchaeota archaeon]